MRRCRRTFVLLAAGGVKVRWACGAEVVVADETAIDVDILAERPALSHHHHKYLHHRESP